MNGWTEAKAVLRREILLGLNADIICLSETHLIGEETIFVDKYTWYSHNRPRKHINIHKGSGGVGVFIKNALFEEIDINIVDKSFDGILGIQLRHKITDFTFIVVSCYLAPENSPWSNSTQFFSNLIAQLYMFNDIDAVY